MQATPLPDPSLQYGEGLGSFGDGFIFAQGKHLARYHPSSPWQPMPFNFFYKFAPLDNDANRDLESEYNAKESITDKSLSSKRGKQL